jgi:DNA-3-methyladenine glycosylase
VVTVAKELLGKYLVRVTAEGNIVARIVEVEAYGGSDDSASHAYKGIRERNRVMFGEPGHAYVYFTYGMHFCLNVKAEHIGIPGAVLIRAVEIIDGLELASRNRSAKSSIELSNGPGKLTKAMNITKAHNGIDLVKTTQLYICKPEDSERSEISASTRIGIKTAKEKLWRFCISNEACQKNGH